MSHKAGMRLHQRDCFGAAFVDQMGQMKFLAHEVPFSIVAKMTSALQFTDIDFSHQFKAFVRQSADETMRKECRTREAMRQLQEISTRRA
jgi:hypothetical protein